MLRFFRSIRQKLLANHKIGQYLKYAAGEIILVVLGILIALQINNWNENRKEKAAIKTHLLNLVEDLKSDSIVLLFPPEITTLRPIGNRATAHHLQSSQRGGELIHFAKDGDVLARPVLVEQLANAAFQNINSITKAEGKGGVGEQLHPEPVRVAELGGFLFHETGEQPGQR